MADLGRNVFRFKRGMKTALLNQVATDNPEGMGCSSKGWEVVVNKLRESGPEWELLTSRCARENVRDMLREWHREKTKVDKTTGTGSNETEDDAFLQEISDLWAARKETNDKKKNESATFKDKKSRDAGIALRQAATEGLRTNMRCEEGEEEDNDENCDIPRPAKRQRKQDAIWSYLREAKESDKNLKERDFELRARQLDIDAEKVQLEKERVRVQALQQEEQRELQRQQQQHSFRLQQQQMQAMLSLLNQFKK